MPGKETVIETSILNCHNTLEERLLEQAEISFKAGEDKGYKNGSIDGYNEAAQKAIDGMFEKLQTGRKAGMKEVAGWLDQNFEPTVPMSLTYEKWHTKLIEWGIE